jgi:hypothetical protein
MVILPKDELGDELMLKVTEVVVLLWTFVSKDSELPDGLKSRFVNPLKIS